MFGFFFFLFGLFGGFAPHGFAGTYFGQGGAGMTQSVSYGGTVHTMDSTGGPFAK